MIDLKIEMNSKREYMFQLIRKNLDDDYLLFAIFSLIESSLAPSSLSTSAPFLKKMKVGMHWIPQWVMVSLFWSTSTLKN